MFRSSDADAALPASNAPSRRALLAGAAAGLGAWAATALSRPKMAHAGVDGDVVLGAANVATTQTLITNSTNNNTVFRADSDGGGRCVMGASNSGIGVYGTSVTDLGVLGASSTSVGVQGEGFGSEPAVVGWHHFSGNGVLGYSSDALGTVPAAKPKTGVFGYATQDTSSRGMWGESPAGIGVYGRTTTGFAGYFHGKVFTNSFVEILEMATPAAPGANRARLFVRDVGGKTQLCVRFPTGTVKLLAQEA